MKEQDGAIILSANENIGPQDVSVLRAGLQKLFESGKKSVLLDLHEVTEAQLGSSVVRSDLSALTAWAYDQQAVVLVVSLIPQLGNVASIESGLADLKSPMGKLLSFETKLRLEASHLQDLKIETEKRLSEASSGGGDLKTLRSENSSLKQQITELERLARRLLKAYREPFESSLYASRNKILDESLKQVLEKEGLLK